MEKREKLPAGVLFAAQDARKLMMENPDLPVCFLATEEANTGDYNTMFCTSIHAEIGEILDCQQDIKDEIIFTDRDDFEDELYCMLDYSDDFDSEEALDAEFKRLVAEYKPYWKKCILVTVGN